jgi:hypothetical protein
VSRSRSRSLQGFYGGGTDVGPAGFVIAPLGEKKVAPDSSYCRSSHRKFSLRSTIQPVTSVVGPTLPGRAFFISSLDQLQPRRCAGLFLYRVRGRRSGTIQPAGSRAARLCRGARSVCLLRLGCLGPWQTVGDVSSLADIVMRRAPGDLGGVAGKSPGAQAWMKRGEVDACTES